jgi:hypothetical protein
MPASVPLLADGTDFLSSTSNIGTCIPAFSPFRHFLTNERVLVDLGGTIAKAMV